MIDHVGYGKMLVILRLKVLRVSEKSAEHLQHLLPSAGAETLNFSQLTLSTHQDHPDNELRQIRAPWLALWKEI